MRKVWLSLLVAGLVGSLALPSHGEEKVRLILKSARQASTYYAFAVGQANAIMAGAPDVEMTVVECILNIVRVESVFDRSLNDRGKKICDVVGCLPAL